MLLIVHIYIDTTHEIRSVNTLRMYYIRHGFHGLFEISFEALSAQDTSGPLYSKAKFKKLHK